MEHTKRLEELNKEALDKLEEFMQSKKFSDKEKQDSVHSAKEKWQSAWNEFLETLLVLERLEI